MRNKKTALVGLLFLLAFTRSYSQENLNPQRWYLNYMDGGGTKIWRYASVIWDYNKDGGIPISGADDLFICNCDGTAMVVRGEIDKDPSDTVKCDFYNWEIRGKKLFLTSLNKGNLNQETMVADILVLNYQLFAYRYQAGSYSIDMVFVPVVYPNPYASAKNAMLTDGWSKLWAISEMTKDGEPFAVPDWRKDDMMLFNTDGTGYFLKGEKDETPNDTNNNDRFLWEFTDGETKIHTRDFETAYEVSDCTIIELSADRFVYEAPMQWEGKTYIFRITRVPAVRQLGVGK